VKCLRRPEPPGRPLLDVEKAKACKKLNLIRLQLHNYIEARGIPAAARGQRGA